MSSINDILSIKDISKSSNTNNINWENAKKKWKYHAFVVIAFAIISSIALYSENKIVGSIPLLVIGCGLIYMGIISFKLKVIRFASFNVTANTREVKQGAITYILIGISLILWDCYVVISYLML
jgi:hypothetical protein